MWRVMTVEIRFSGPVPTKNVFLNCKVPMIPPRRGTRHAQFGPRRLPKSRSAACSVHLYLIATVLLGCPFIVRINLVSCNDMILPQTLHLLRSFTLATRCQDFCELTMSHPLLRRRSTMQSPHLDVVLRQTRNLLRIFAPTTRCQNSGVFRITQPLLIENND